jgi:hypothetical protein
MLDTPFYIACLRLRGRRPADPADPAEPGSIRRRLSERPGLIAVTSRPARR